MVKLNATSFLKAQSLFHRESLMFFQMVKLLLVSVTKYKQNRIVVYHVLSNFYVYN